MQSLPLSCENKCSDDARGATTATQRMMCGNNVSETRVQGIVAKELKINQNRILENKNHNYKVLKDPDSCWILTEKKTLDLMQSVLSIQRQPSRFGKMQAFCGRLAFGKDGV